MEISLREINSGYEEIVLKNINLDIKSGSYNFIIGETGSGKSTLLQTIGFLLKNKTGDIFWKNKNLSLKEHLKDYRENYGYMFQYTEKQFFNSTIKEEIIYSLVKRKISPEEIEKKLDEILELLKLSKDILTRSPYEVSGGQKRFIALASILITSPKILLLDEPTAGLDIENKKLFFTILDKLKKSGITIIQISHLLEDVLEYGDNVVALEKGKIIAQGKPFEVLKNSDLDFIKFCEIMNNFGVSTENIRNIDELLERIR
ncbi:energy-coupling factor ABC transporter ATP-binding protein [Cetobacterium sp. ZWU0022]|uniref:energy-coupling factor ABC transporter ATP-binding protein n=1 Tax=Cetobacterium sp. ZWU0022 TaxID=1340502 RepID=UPI000646D5F5|nr:ATP-binding cassette domain-containing protein [Cetobacterium sp. ZWU0022]